LGKVTSLKIFGTVIVVLVSVMATYAQYNVLPAFPGAEGEGKFTTGGRGGKVIYVTNLNDDALPGSLRYALNQTGPRYILFKVSGTIQLKSKLNITKGDVTIAGQSAPGDGICLRDFSVENQADNVIIRYIRFRMGDEAKQQDDAFWGRNHANIIVDHCTMSWSTDECASFYDNSNFTMQWCLLSESLRISVHDKGAHGYGGIWGGKKVSFHHNLLADHDSRNPRFCGSRYSNRPDLEMVDYRNNVIFNWGGNSAYAAEGGSYNMINNYYKPGPATSSSSKTRIIQPYPDDGTNSQPAGTYGKFYIAGNYISGSSAVTNDNWMGVNPHPNFGLYTPVVTINDLKSVKEFSATTVTTHTAETAYVKVLDYAGACLARDAVDQRIIHDVTIGIPTFVNGGNGSANGIIDTQTAVGGWPELKTIPAPADSDGDGIPDAWEDANGLLKNSSSDSQLTTVDGKYPNIEAYLNSLVAAITDNQLKDGLYTAIAENPKINVGSNFQMDGTTGILHVNLRDKIKTIRIYALSGARIKSQDGNDTSAELCLNDLRPGIYIVSVTDVNRVTYARKIVKYQ
jgi:pectate lyase